MSGLEVAVAIPAFVAVARKVATGISRISGLRHAPDVLLVLNNEVVDLQCIIVSHPSSFYNDSTRGQRFCSMSLGASRRTPAAEYWDFHQAEFSPRCPEGE